MRSRRILTALVFFIAVTSGCSTVFYQPDHAYYFPPERFNLRPRQIQFQASDGTRLIGWFFAAKMNKDEHPKGTIVQFHGNAENMSSHYLSLAWITARGYNLFTFDYRGYGQSDGNPDQAGLYRDALAALAQSWRFHIESKAPRFAVVGESLGGAVAMRALPDWLPHTRIDLIVMDSTFLSYRQVARRILARHWYTWLLQPLAYLLISDEYSATSAAAENRQKLWSSMIVRIPSFPSSAARIFSSRRALQKIFGN